MRSIVFMSFFASGMYYCRNWLRTSVSSELRARPNHNLYTDHMCSRYTRTLFGKVLDSALMLSFLSMRSLCYFVMYTETFLPAPRFNASVCTGFASHRVPYCVSLRFDECSCSSNWILFLAFISILTGLCRSLFHTLAQQVKCFHCKTSYFIVNTSKMVKDTCYR